MWEPSRATSDKDINGLVLLASAGCRLFGERRHRETVYVLCGGKGTAPGCALHGSPKVPSDSTIGLISAYLHPQSKGEELRELVKWMKSNKVDHPLYISGDFNQADVAFPDVWNDLLYMQRLLTHNPTCVLLKGPMVTRHSIEYYAPLNI